MESKSNRDTDVKLQLTEEQAKAMPISELRSIWALLQKVSAR